MNWIKFQKEFKNESTMFIYGYLEFFITLIAILSLLLALYGSIELAKQIKLQGITDTTNSNILIVSISAFVSFLCFFLLQLLRRKRRKNL